MQRFTAAAVATLLTVLATAAPAHAQNRPFYFVGGGITVPTGDYGDYAKTGWLVDGGIGIPAGSTGQIWWGADVMYGSNKHEGDAGDKTNLYGAHGNLGYAFMPEGFSPYVYGTAGFLVHKYSPGDSGFESESDTDFAWGGAAGVSAPMGGFSVWAEARYVARGDTKFIPLVVGVTFGGSSN